MFVTLTETRDLFYLHGLTLIPGWMTSYISLEMDT